MKRGIQIGEYVLVELLNSGGMGQVWLAHKYFEGGGKNAVAFKFPHAAGVLDARVRSGLLDEARLQMRLQHPNIPRATDMGVHEGLPYFVMDYIAGRSLGQLLGRMREVGRPLRFELIAHIAREIGYALRYAHTFEMAGVAQQLIHRDVAPKNVLVSGQGGVYVIDFGVSEAVGVHSSRNHVKGTLMYMAPEHALGFPTPKSDGWGLGAILWEAIEGRRFRGDIDPDDIRRAANVGLHRPLSRPDIPESLRFVTEGLLRVDERDRLTLDEVLAPLEDKEFPSQRTALCDLLRRRFGVSVVRSGQTLNDFQMPAQLDQAIAAARVVKDAGHRREHQSWSLEAFEAAGAVPVVPVDGTLRVPRVAALDDEDDGEDRRPRQSTYVEPKRLERTLRMRRPRHEISDREPPPKTQLITPPVVSKATEVDESMVTTRVPRPDLRSDREGKPQIQPWEPLTSPEPDAPAFFRRGRGQTRAEDAAPVAPTPPHDDGEAESNGGRAPLEGQARRHVLPRVPGIPVRAVFVVVVALIVATLCWLGLDLYGASRSTAPAPSLRAGSETPPAASASQAQTEDGR